MKVFYYDETIKKYERELDFSPIIDYLEKKFLSNKEVIYLNSLISYSWYFLEGDINQEPKNFDWEYLLLKWKQYHELGMNDFNNYPEFCLVSGYIYGLHGFYFDKFYNDKLGDELIKKCFNTTQNEKLKAVAKFYLDNRKKKTGQCLADW